jgi:hypothetical protein
VSQTSYGYAPDAEAVPGQLADNSSADVVSRIASGTIPFGCLVEEASDGTVSVPSGTSLGKVGGIALFDTTHARDGWVAGEAVPVLRRGRVYTAFSGGTQTNLTAAKVNHSSTIATHRGKLCAGAADTDAGEEVTALTGVVFIRSTGETDLALVEVSLS